MEHIQNNRSEALVGKENYMPPSPGLAAWEIVLSAIAVGAVGGFVSGLLTNGGIVSPSRDKKTVRLGAIADLIIGAVAGLVPCLQALITAQTPYTNTTLFTVLVASLLLGLAGARGLQSEIDKGQYKEAVGKALKQKPNDTLAGEVGKLSAGALLKKVSLSG